jgi:hypothetical protein
MCLKCENLYDSDGFSEHGIATTLFLCKCGAVIDKHGNILEGSKIDMSGLEGRSNLFIFADRYAGRLPTKPPEPLKVMFGISKRPRILGRTQRTHIKGLPRDNFRLPACHALMSSEFVPVIDGFSYYLETHMYRAEDGFGEVYTKRKYVW